MITSPRFVIAFAALAFVFSSTAFAGPWRSLHKDRMPLNAGYEHYNSFGDEDGNLPKVIRIKSTLP